MNAVLESTHTVSTIALHSEAARSAEARQTPYGEHLVFTLGAEEYGIDILKVQEIRSYEAPTRIADASPCVKGVVNLRGAIVPIVDLRLKLGCAHVEYIDTTAVIVLNLGTRIVGAVVDAVSDVVAIDAQSVAPPPELSRASQGECIAGIARLKNGELDRLLILLDIGGLLAQEIQSPTPGGLGVPCGA